MKSGLVIITAFGLLGALFTKILKSEFDTTFRIVIGMIAIGLYITALGYLQYKYHYWKERRELYGG